MNIALFTSFHSVFHSFHGLMNSIKWPALSVWVFVAQVVEHCSANSEAMSLNPLEAPKNLFVGVLCNCLNCDSLRWSHIHFRFFFKLKLCAQSVDELMMSEMQKNLGSPTSFRRYKVWNNTLIVKSWPS